jgi:hypothetical protein
MDLISLFSKADKKLILAATIGSSIGAIAGLLKDKDDIAKTYINLCQGIVYGGISGPIIYSNPLLPIVIMITVFGYSIHNIDIYSNNIRKGSHSHYHNHNNNHHTHKNNELPDTPFFDHY